MPVDLRHDALIDGLVAGGLSVDRPAVFVLEGLTMYLPEADVRRVLGELATACAPGSRLTTDFYPPSDAGSARNRRQDLLQRLARGGSGEDLHLAVDPDDAIALVEASGWTVLDARPTRAVARWLVPPGAGLPVDHINPRKSLLAARC